MDPCYGVAQGRTPRHRVQNVTESAAKSTVELAESPTVPSHDVIAFPGHDTCGLRRRWSLLRWRAVACNGCGPVSPATPYGSRRHCSRPTCSDAAVVTLTYEYKRSQVWLDVLTVERDPHSYDLCRKHATAMSVPLGWHLTDRQGFIFGRDVVDRAS